LVVEGAFYSGNDWSCKRREMMVDAVLLVLEFDLLFDMYGARAETIESSCLNGSKAVRRHKERGNIWTA
jgi:hypothetical protein